MSTTPQSQQTATGDDTTTDNGTNNPPLRLIGALDQGTTSTRFIIFDASTLHEVVSHQIEHEQYHPEPGWSEHEPMEIIEKTKRCMVEALEKLISRLEKTAGEEEEDTNDTKNVDVTQMFELCAIGVTNQRETTVVWDSETGEPLYRAIVWNDMRTSELVDRIIHENVKSSHSESRLNLQDEEVISRRSLAEHNFLQRECGLPLSTYFSGTKLRWMIENVDRVKQAMHNKRCMFGTVDTWLIWNLTGGVNGGKYVTDVTNASRTMLMNLETMKWDDRLKSVFKVPLDDSIRFPEIRSNSEHFGELSIELKNGTKIQTVITGCVGDQQSAVIGQRCFKVGEAKSTYGTGCFVLMNMGTRPVFSSHGLLTTVGYQLGANSEVVFALEGSVAVAGSGVQWLKDKMGIISELDESEALASTVENTGGVYFIPAFSGLFAPYWRADARGTIVGLTHYTTRAHICRAMLEAVSHQTQEVLDAMRNDSGVSLSQLYVDGGMSNNAVVMQCQADLLGVPVVRPSYIETTAVGAAICAAIGRGIYRSMDDIPPVPSDEETVFVSMKTQEQRELELKRWNLAIEKSYHSTAFSSQ